MEAVDYALSKVGCVRGLITAYNTNVDAVKHVQGAKIEEILRSDRGLQREVLKRLKNPPGEVNDVADLMAGLLHHIQTGVGGEWLILTEEVFKWLNLAFGYDELRMGGQAGIMANVLAAVGVPLVVPHVAQLPRVQAELFSGEGNIRIPTFLGEELTFKPPLEAVRLGDKPLIHWILEFSAETEIALNAFSIKTPRGNRFIATYDEDNTEMRIAPSFLEGTRKILDRVDGAIVSGYHLLRRRYRNGSGFYDKIDRTLNQLREWKALNPCLKLHLELGSVQHPEVGRAVLKRVTPMFESLGLNEDELHASLMFLGYRKLAETLKETPSAPRVYMGARQLQRELRLRRVNVHTRDFSLSLLKPNHWATPRREQQALLFGAATAATRAATGRFMTVGGLRAVLVEPFLWVSGEGLEQFVVLADALGEAGGGVEEAFLSQGFVDLEDLSVVFIPSKVVERPLSTVGLGDAMASASFLLSLAAADECSM